MAGLKTSLKMGSSLGALISIGARRQPQGGGVSITVLRREIDGTVTIVSLGKPFTPKLTRQPDGTVTVGA